MKKILFALPLLLATLLVACSSDDDSNNAQPVVSAIFPTEAKPGEAVTIQGANFGASRIDVDGHVFFNGIEAADYRSWSDNHIVVSVPRGYTTGHVVVMANGVSNHQIKDDATKFLAYNPDNIYVHSTFSKYLMCADVVKFTGNSNPCDYADGTGRGTVIGEMGKNPNYKGSSSAKSFALWDSNPGDYTIFKFTITEKDVPAKFFVSFKTAAQVYDSYVNVEISKDLDELDNNTSYDNNNSMDVTWSQWSFYTGPWTMGPFILEEPGDYYMRCLMMNANPENTVVATLQFLQIAN